MQGLSAHEVRGRLGHHLHVRDGGACRAVVGESSLEGAGREHQSAEDGIVHVRYGFEFLGYKIKRGGRPMRLPTSKIRTCARPGALYAFPREKSIRHFRDQIRRLTLRNATVSTQELIEQVNPVVRGWGHHYKRAHVRKLFHRLDGWLVRRIWSHRFGKWRCCGWTTLPRCKLYGEFGLVNLVALIPSIATQRSSRQLTDCTHRQQCAPTATDA